MASQRVGDLQLQRIRARYLLMCRIADMNTIRAVIGL